MAILFSGAAWAALVLYLLCRTLRQFRAYRQLALAVPSEFSVLPSVSIIVPARDEIHNIDLCLGGLRAQTGLSGRWSIIVVDDDSQDGTAAAVERYSAGDSRIRLASAGVLPEGWVGKPHACWRGALLAESDWLCFVDADVRAAPQLVAAAVAAAEAQGIDMLSLHPLQELGSFWERTIMPAGLLVLACAKSLKAGAEDAANGQFLLVRRTIYFQVGGHSAVRAEIAEDKALAASVKQAGFEFRVLAAERLARTRMYRNFASLWEGLSKNAAEVLGGPIVTLAAGAAAFAFGWTSLLVPPAIIIAAVGEPSPAVLSGATLALFGSAVTIGIQCATARHFHIPAAFGLIFALGYSAVACLACNGVLVSLNGAGHVERKNLSAGQDLSESSVNPRDRRPVRRRSFVGGWAIAAVLAVLAVLLYQIRIALLPFVFAVAVAFVLDPLIRALQQRLGSPRWPIAAVLYGVILAILGGTGYWIGTTAVPDLIHVVARAPEILRHFLDELIGSQGITLFGQTYTPEKLVSALGGAMAGMIGLTAVERVAGLAASIVFGGFLTLVLMPYFMISAPRLTAGAIWLLPPERRRSVEDLLPKIVPVLRRYLIGLCVVVFYTAIVAWIGFGPVFHLPNAVLLALTVSVLELIPVIGPFASGTIVGLVAIQQSGIWATALLFGFAIALRLSIDNVVGPIVLGEAARIHPVVVIISFVCGAILFGVVGLLIAVPVAVCIKVTLQQYYAEPIADS